MNKNFRTVLLYLVLLAVLVWVVMVQLNKTTDGRPTELPTSDFVTAVKEGRVQEVTYVVRDNKLAGKYWETEKAKAAKETPKAFTSTYVGEDSLAELMAAHPDRHVHRRRIRAESRGSRSCRRCCRFCCWSSSCSSS